MIKNLILLIFQPFFRYFQFERDVYSSVIIYIALSKMNSFSAGVANHEIMKLVYLFLHLFTCLACAGGMSKEDLLKKLEEHASQVKTTYQTTIQMKISSGNGIVISDSGVLAVEPDGCFYIKFLKSNTEQWDCNDTSWQKDKRGGISRTKGTKRHNKQFSAPNVNELAAQNEIKIVREDSNSILIETVAELEDEPKIKMHLLVDKNEYLIRKTTVFTPGAGPIETGYFWQKFEKAAVLKEIATVMPMGGFMKMTFTDYMRIKKLPEIR